MLRRRCSAACSSRERHLAEDDCVICPGSARNVAGKPVPGKPAKQSKCRSLFGFNRDARVGGGRNLDAKLREAFAKETHQCGVLSATTSGDKFGAASQRCVLSKMRPADAAVGIEDTSCGERSGRSDNVLLARSARAIAKRKKLVSEVRTELLTTAGLRRWFREVDSSEKALNDWLDHATARGDSAILVEATLVELLHEDVNEYVGRAGIERKHAG